MNAQTMTPERFASVMAATEETKVRALHPDTTEFSISSTILHRHIKALLPVISKNPIVPILENILFSIYADDQVDLTASDLQTTMFCRLSVERSTSVFQPSIRFCIDARRLYKLLTGLPEQPVTISYNGMNKATLKTEFGQYNFYAELGADFPKLPEIKDATTLNLGGKILAATLRQTLPFTSNDDLRPAMTGVYFDENRLASTDGHRLIRLELDNFKTEQPFILPYKTGNLFLKAYGKSDSAVSIDVSPSKNSYGDNRLNAGLAMIRLTWANFTLIGRLIDEKFPDYKNAIPANNPIEVTINRQAMILLLDRVMVFANSVTHQIRFTFDGGRVLVSAENSDYEESCHESLTATTSNLSIEIGFNASLMIHLLKHLPGSHVQMQMSQPNRACLLHPTDGEPDLRHTALLMPVMLNTYSKY